jgi:hypothetical protein
LSESEINNLFNGLLLILLLLLLSGEPFDLLTAASPEHPDPETHVLLVSAAHYVSGAIMKLVPHPLAVIPDVLLDAAGLRHQQGRECGDRGLIHVHEDLSAECLVRHRGQEGRHIHLLGLSPRRRSLLLRLLDKLVSHLLWQVRQEFRVVTQISREGIVGWLLLGCWLGLGSGLRLLSLVLFLLLFLCLARLLLSSRLLLSRRLLLLILLLLNFRDINRREKLSPQLFREFSQDGRINAICHQEVIVVAECGARWVYRRWLLCKNGLLNFLLLPHLFIPQLLRQRLLLADHRSVLDLRLLLLR